MTSFAALVFSYSLYEFFMTRILWRSSAGSAGRGGHALSKGVLLLATLCLGSIGFLTAALGLELGAVALVYTIFEYFSARGTAEERIRTSLAWFIVKQSVISILLYATWRSSAPMMVHDWFEAAERALLPAAGGDAVRGQYASILTIASAYLFVIDGGTRIVKGVLGRFPRLYQKVLQTLNAGPAGGPQTESEENVGEWIGILERIITLTLVLTGNYGAIAFVLTAKSIARFKALENKDFAEYYLLGTSASIIASLAAGVLVRIVLGF